MSVQIKTRCFDHGELTVQQHKAIFTNSVYLEIKTLSGEFIESDGELNQQLIDQGYEICGELAFDSIPLEWNDKHEVKKGVLAQLKLSLNENSSSFDILFVEKTGESDLVKDGRQIKVKRYFWKFFVIKPKWDRLEILPEKEYGVPHVSENLNDVPQELWQYYVLEAIKRFNASPNKLKLVNLLTGKTNEQR